MSDRTDRTDRGEKPPGQRRSRAGDQSRRTSANADGRTRQPRGDRRRQQILDAAVELFAAKGYRSTGVAALAERVGMTAPGMLYYFGSKEGLLRETVAERDRASAPHAGDVGTLSSLRDIGKHNVETATLVRLYVVLGAESLDPDDPLHDFFVERYETARALTRELLQREHDEGRIRADSDIDQLAREIIAVIMGLEVQWLADPERVDLETSIRDYIDRLIRDLAP
jgi:AcrR family transcriptional regulator